VVMNGLILCLIGGAMADPPVPTPLLLIHPSAPDHVAFVVVRDDGSPALLAPAQALSNDATMRLTWTGTNKVGLKLKRGQPDAVATACAPGGQPLGSRRVPQRLDDSSLALAPAEPVPLEHVWVVALGQDGSWLHAATVSHVDGETLRYVFQQPVPLISATGAPVIDVLGRLVGVHDQVEPSLEGRVYGAACTLTATRAALGSP